MTVGVKLHVEMNVSVVTALSWFRQGLRGVRRVSTECTRFTVIDVDLELPGLTDIADKVIPGVIPVSPAETGRNNVLLIIHHHGDSGAVIVRTDHSVIRLGKKNRMLVETILVRISCTVDSESLPAGICYAAFRIALAVTLLPQPGNRRGIKAGKQCACQHKPGE